MTYEIAAVIANISLALSLKSIIASVNKGKNEFAPGSNVPLLKLFNKFLPKAGLNLIDKMSRKQLQLQ